MIEKNKVEWLNRKNKKINFVLSACPACPVGKNDRIGVGRNDRIRVSFVVKPVFGLRRDLECLLLAS